MRVITLSLLLQLWAPSGSSLRCYVCSAMSNNELCNSKSQDCYPPLDTCMTTVNMKNSETAIVKQCASRATCQGAAALVNHNGNGNKVQCCSTGLCNYNTAPASIRLHTGLLVLPLCHLTFMLMGTSADAVYF